MDDNQKSYIHTPKPQIQSVEPKERKIGYRNNTLCFWWGEKNQEALIYFLGVFGVWKREKHLGKLGRKQYFKKNGPSLVWGVLRAIYSPNTNFKVAMLQGPPASKSLWSGWSWHFWKGLDFLFLKRYGTRKSNGWIKSYGSWKFVVHWSVRHSNFCDILAALTLISTHE